MGARVHRRVLLRHHHADHGRLRRPDPEHRCASTCCHASCRDVLAAPAPAPAPAPASALAPVHPAPTTRTTAAVDTTLGCARRRREAVLDPDGARRRDRLRRAGLGPRRHAHLRPGEPGGLLQLRLSPAFHRLFASFSPPFAAFSLRFHIAFLRSLTHRCFAIAARSVSERSHCDCRPRSTRSSTS